MTPDAPPPLLPPILGAPAPLPAAAADVPAGAPRAAVWRSILGLVLLGSYVALPALLGNDPPADGKALLPDTVGRLLVVCGTELALFTLAFGVALWLGRLPRAHLLLRWPRTGWLWPRALGWSVALRLSVGLVLGAALVGWQVYSGESLRNLDQLRPKVEAMVSVDALRDPVYLLLSVTLVSFVLAGLREELWRAAMMGFLGESFPRVFGGRFGPWLAIVPVAVLFGLAHIPQGWMGVAATGILGLGLGAIMRFHRSVWDAVLAHGFFNATTFALLPFIGEYLSRAQAQ